MGIEAKGREYHEIQLNKGATPFSVKCSDLIGQFSPVFLIVEKDAFKQIWGVGASDIGLLGMREDCRELTKFKCLKYMSDVIEFDRVETIGKRAYALTTNGNLYGWGDSNNKELGPSLPSSVWQPTEITYLLDYIVSDFK